MNSSAPRLKSTTHVETSRSRLRKKEKKMELHLKKSMQLAVVGRSAEATQEVQFPSLGTLTSSGRIKRNPSLSEDHWDVHLPAQLHEIGL